MKHVLKIRNLKILSRSAQKMTNAGTSFPCTQKGRICCDNSGCTESYCTYLGCLID